MKIELDDVARLLNVMAVFAPLAPVPQLQQILHYAALLVKLGDEATTRRKVLLAKVQRWVDEKRGPSTDELVAMQVARDALDDELAALEAQLLAAGAQP